VTINQAVSQRIRDLLIEKNMTQYRLEQDSDIAHSQMGYILKDRNESLNFKTIIKIAKGFGMTIQEFLNSPLFTYDNLNTE